MTNNPFHYIIQTNGTGTIYKERRIPALYFIKNMERVPYLDKNSNKITERGFYICTQETMNVWNYL